MDMTFLINKLSQKYINGETFRLYIFLNKNTDFKLIYSKNYLNIYIDINIYDYYQTNQEVYDYVISMIKRKIKYFS